MLFSEIYSSYYNAVAEILRLAVRGELTKNAMYGVVRRRAFGESIMTIPEFLADGTWKLLDEDMETPIEHEPTMPLTHLQKRWMKSILSDPRVNLFSPSGEGLENVQPLYPSDVFVYFDRYSDGDPYSDPVYIEHFRTALTALREKRYLSVSFTGHHGRRFTWNCIPRNFEYSSKDDKFRLIAYSGKDPIIINMARVTACKLGERFDHRNAIPPEVKKKTLVLELKDERNGLDRVMLHFSHLEKECQRIGGEKYRLTLKYYGEDETEILIRVLSFGPVLRVVSPDSFADLVRERLDKQKKLRTL